MRRSLLAAACAVAAALLSAAPAAHATPSTGTLPADPSAKGYIGLCDEAGRNVTGGSIDAKPFVWKAVASVAPPARFQGPGQNTALNVYQPRPQTAAVQWSGAPLTAASFYANKAHPAAQATYADVSLATVIKDYPPKVNGLYVLRMFYGKANYGIYNATYPTATIQVVGTRWHVVSGGTVDCASATARSNEELAGAVSRADVTPRAASARGDQTVATHPSAGRSTSRSAGGAAVGPVHYQPVDLAASHRSDSSSGLGWLWAVVPAAVLLALGAVVWRRRTAS